MKATNKSLKSLIAGLRKSGVKVYYNSRLKTCEIAGYGFAWDENFLTLDTHSPGLGRVYVKLELQELEKPEVRDYFIKKVSEESQRRFKWPFDFYEHMLRVFEELDSYVNLPDLRDEVDEESRDL